MPTIPHLLLFFFLLATIKVSVKAMEFTVGDDGKWGQGVNFLIWSHKYNFTVGDILDFSYVKGQHDVYEVTEDTYRTCDSRSGVIAIYDSGNDRVSLTEARQYWFICNTKGHCNGGMRFGIKVQSESSPPPLLQAPPPTFSPPIPTGNGIERRIKGWMSTYWNWAIVVVLFCFR